MIFGLQFSFKRPWPSGLVTDISRRRAGFDTQREQAFFFFIFYYLRAVCCKNRLRVCKIEKSDFLKICQNKGFSEVVLKI